MPANEPVISPNAKAPVQTPPIPQVKPGHEKDKFLREDEVMKMNIHFAGVKLLQEQLTNSKLREENFKLKIQLCDLTKSNYMFQQKAVSENGLTLEKQIDQVQENYEKTTQTDIKKRLNIPLEKKFSYDPVNLKVTIEG